MAGVEATPPVYLLCVRFWGDLTVAGVEAIPPVNLFRVRFWGDLTVAGVEAFPPGYLFRVPPAMLNKESKRTALVNCYPHSTVPLWSAVSITSSSILWTYNTHAQYAFHEDLIEYHHHYHLHYHAQTFRCYRVVVVVIVLSILVGIIIIMIIISSD